MDEQRNDGGELIEWLAGADDANGRIFLRTAKDGCLRHSLRLRRASDPHVRFVTRHRPRSNKNEMVGRVARCGDGPGDELLVHENGLRRGRPRRSIGDGAALDL